MRRNLSGSRNQTQQAVICLLCLVFLFQATVRSQSPDPVQILEQVAMHIRDIRLPQAEKELDQVLRVTPDLPAALNLLGTIRAKQERIPEAESLFLRAVRNDKNFVGARMNLVYLYLLRNTPANAILQLKEVVVLEPEN